MNNRGKHRVLAISDTQEPFGHRDAIPFLKWVKKKYAPDTVVHVGDEMDFHALGDWDHDPDGFSAGHELQRGLERLQQYYDLFPTVMACTSNHTARPYRRAFKHGLPRAFLRDYSEFLRAPKGWEWRDQWEVDDVVYEHGEGFSGYQGALNCAAKHGKSTVIGHIHSHAGILWTANERDLMYGFNVGCLIDRHAYAFRYGRNHRYKPILGVGIIDKAVPTYVPMLLDTSGRWIGR